MPIPLSHTPGSFLGSTKAVCVGKAFLQAQHDDMWSLWKGSLGSDMAVQGAPCCILHDNGKVLVCQEALMEAHYVRMYQPRVVHELALHIFRQLILRTPSRQQCGISFTAQWQVSGSASGSRSR